VVQSSDAAHYIAWKRDGALTACVPEDVAKHFPAQYRDADGMFASWRLACCMRSRQQVAHIYRADLVNFSVCNLNEAD